ncbi:hypothetical protein BD289DRAFT_435562 [Coniella lustricola]|uniref:DUF2415 domain-containing protein n=1 Tax=Coniella lustricola TaxID=2025994 RepID=A0A2T3A6H1_9PEZI|nr:hypothetical protein BD289DRAFT_435562 [Coniella lustricola]
MAVTDDRIYHSTDALILTKPKRHYRVGLRCEHWQLRSQIGVCSEKHVFYVGGNGNTQVHKLDPTTQESEVVKILTFVPRCLVARNGWVCCGGENGEFAGFQIDDDADNNDAARGPASSVDLSLSYIRNHIENGGPRSEVLDAFRDHMQGLSADDRLQLALDVASDPSDPAPPLNASSPRPDVHNKGLLARSKTFGKERVNCITLWFPATSLSERAPGAYSQSVAVLANNDKHVTIVGLEDQEAVDELSYPDYVNRALISPDGQFLVAVCDDPYLYVHKRTPKQVPGQGLFTRKDVFDYEWQLCAKTHIKSQRKEDRSDQRGSFAACFSGTGRYLAVGTQYGVISIFEVAAFTEPDRNALITTFNSSRPKEDVGAVRDMAFCPGPFDLLAWTEHRGHIGVADIRSNYVSRQILDLNEYDAYTHIMVTEKGSIDPRMLERNEDGELTLAAELMDSTGRRGASRRLASDFHSPLNAEDTVILEALSDQRRQRDQRAAAARGIVADNTRLVERLQSRAALARETSLYRDLRNNRSTFDILNSAGNEPGQSGESTTEGTRDYLASVWNTIHRHREREAQTEALRVTRARMGGRTVLNINRTDHEPDDTAGLAWSDDGRMLYIGAEDGIYEFQVNVFDRKMFPSISLR